jgi:cell wall-associated NlpC family hydrolase
MPVKSAQAVLLGTAFLLLAACASAPRMTSDNPDAPEFTALPGDAAALPGALRAEANDVLFQALGLVGTPYRFGGNSPESGFDCSGLINYVFLHSAGLSLPRTTRELIEIDAPAVEKDSLYPGDLVYFNTRGGRVSHIGIYVGEGRFVHAPSSGGTVRMDRLDTPYWRKHYVAAKRVLQAE